MNASRRRRGVMLSVAAAIVALALPSGFGCRRTPGTSANPDAGPTPLKLGDVLCVERPEGCVYCDSRTVVAALLDSDDPRPSLCDPKDDESCVDFCSRLAPECALPWSGAGRGATCLLPSEEEFRRALFWRETADRPEAMLLGRAIDESAKRIEGAKVRVWFLGTPIIDETSGKDGLFRIRLRAGPWAYAVRVTHPGRASEIVEVRLGPPERPERHPGTPRIFRLGPESIIRGRVVDAAGAPVVGASVNAVRTPEEVIESGQGETAEDGSFTIGGLEAKRYFLRVSKFGHLTTTVKPPVIAPAARVAVKLVRTGVLRGRVVDEDGEAEPNATVVAMLSGPTGTANSPIFWTADGEGRFAQDRFAAGTYYVWARHGDVLVYPPAKIEIQDSSLDAELELSLDHRGARVSGRVVPREGFVLDADTRVILRSRSPLAFPRNAVGRAGREGKFVAAGVLPGRYEIAVRSAAGRSLGITRGPREVEIPIEAGSVVALTESIVVRPQPEE